MATKKLKTLLKMETIKKLDEILNRMKGQTITEVIAGGSNGSIVILEVDKEISVFIYCAWRLYTNNTVVTWNDYLVEGTGLSYVRGLLNSRISNVERLNEFDLKVTFGNKRTLTVFSDLSISSTTIEDNWFVADKPNNNCYILNSKFEFVMSKYNEATS
jgi:hypothetical protein